jgi:hypothetical protein
MSGIRTQLKKLRRAKGGAKNFGVFRVKKHDFTPKNHILSNCKDDGLVLWSLAQQYFSYIMAVGFIGAGSVTIYTYKII